jgi:hypothetical protein
VLAVLVAEDHVSQLRGESGGQMRLDHDLALGAYSLAEDWPFALRWPLSGCLDRRSLRVRHRLSRYAVPAIVTMVLFLFWFSWCYANRISGSTGQDLVGMGIL